MIPTIIIISVVAIVVLWAVAQYNGLVKLRNLVQEAWRQIDVELQRRHDLIPNLVETVKAYAKHEKGTFEDRVHALNTLGAMESELDNPEAAYEAFKEIS